MQTTRRTYLRSLGALAVAGTTGLAGCSGVSAEPDSYISPEPAYDGWFDGVRTYRGTHDLRGRPAVTVDVGAGNSLGYFTFAPAAVAVSPGTTVTWTWSGKGGAHDVVALESAFRSPLTDRPDATFVHTFDAPGVYRYYCTPHRGMGMRGAVVVLE